MQLEHQEEREGCELKALELADQKNKKERLQTKALIKDHSKMKKRVADPQSRNFVTRHRER